MMGLDSTVLPEQMLNKMSADDRKKLGRAGMTSSEARDKQMAKDEREAQSQIANYLRLHDLWFDQDAMNKKRVGTIGAADFQFPYKGLWVSWEVKVWGNKLSSDQQDVKAKIEKQRGHFRVISGVQDAKKHLRELDQLTKNAEVEVRDD